MIEDRAYLVEPSIADAMVPMRDGIRLATDIYLPEGKGPFPVLLERTPYGKRRTNRADCTAQDPKIRSKPEIAAQFVAGGFAYVLQDGRGRYASEGHFTKYLCEGEDGEDCLAWIMRQPWCNGEVGTLGLSYGAHVQAALACGNPKGLGAMFLDSGGFSSAYHGGIRQGGAYELKQLTWAYKHALISATHRGDRAAIASIAEQDIRDWIRIRWRKGLSPISAMPEYEAYILEQWDRDVFDHFWKQRGLYSAGWYDRFSDVPQVHMSSWYDPYAQTAIDNFAALSQLKKSPVRLILGPWTHGQRSVTYSGDVDFGSLATLDGNLAVDYTVLRRDWFDHHLRRRDVADPLPDAVTIFRMGGGSGRRNAQGRMDHGGSWMRASSWPLPDTAIETLYLAGGGQLSHTPAAEGEAANCRVKADPANPVPTIGGAVTSAEPIMFAGAFDQRETEALFGATMPGRALADRDDVVSFRTDPLTDAMCVAGNIELRLFVECDTPDADIAIKLVDEYPPNDDYPQGFTMNVAHGILRLRFRNSFEKPEPMVTGKIYEVVVRSFPTCNLFAAGHRLRIDIAGSNFPHFDINPNCDWSDPDAQPCVATLQIHCTADLPSCATIPFVSIR